MIKSKNVEKTIFLRLFGDSPILRILDFLVVNDDFDYSMTDIAELSGTGYATLKLLWPGLIKNNLVIQTRIVGKAKMYKLNFSNPLVSSFKNFYWNIAKQSLKKEIIVNA
jgi:hypothetical protein